MGISASTATSEGAAYASWRTRSTRAIRGARRIVLDNTYLTRAARSYVVEAASRHRVPTRCIWLDTPLAQAQVNLVERLLDGFGALPTPEDVRPLSRREPGVMAPTSQMRAPASSSHPRSMRGSRSWNGPVRPDPAIDGRARRRLLAAAALEDWAGSTRWPGRSRRAPPDLRLEPRGERRRARRLLHRLATCHRPGGTRSVRTPAGPPTCWCRPPLPGLRARVRAGSRHRPGAVIVIGAGRPTARSPRRLARGTWRCEGIFDYEGQI